MTTLPLNPADHAALGLPEEYRALTARLEEAANRYRLSQVLRGLAIASILTLGAGLLAVFAAGALSLPGWMNVGLLLALGGVAVGGYAAFLHRPMFRRASYAEIARIVEENGAGMDNALINAVLLAQDFEAEGTPDRPVAAADWIPHLLRETSGTMAEKPFEKSVPWHATRRAWLALAIFIVVSAVWIALAQSTFAHGISVLASPLRFVPRQGAVRILEVLPGNDTTLAGEPLNFSVRAEGREPGKPLEARLTLEYAGGKPVTYPMLPFGTDGGQFVRSGIVASETMTYVIAVGDTQSDRFTITVLPQIHMTAYSIESIAPAYTGRGKQSLHLKPKDLSGDSAAAKGSLDVPLGSTEVISVTLDAPVKEVLLDVAGDLPISMNAGPDGRSFSARVHILKSLQYIVRVNDGGNRTLKQFPETQGEAFAIRAIPDAPPTVTVSEPGRDVDAKPGNKLPLEAQFADDYGLTEVHLEIAKNQDKEFHTVRRWAIAAKDGKPATSATIRYLLDLSADEYKLGDALRYRFVAADNRDLGEVAATAGGGGPQSAAGQIFAISFNDTTATAVKSTKVWEELRAKLTAILEKQIALRKQAGDLAAGMDVELMRAAASPIQEGQKAIRDDLSSLAKDFPFEPSMKLVQKSLRALAVEDAAAAVERGADILLLSDGKGMPPLATKLRQNQSRIIDVLQTLLAIAAADQGRVARAADIEGGDIPANARDAWKKLDEQLKDFEKEQKAVIDATAELAKKPKADFDAEDKKKTDDLASIEDKWEKFLNERLADMSKLAEQDEANASLLEEMVQMKVELTAAKDALNAKANEIATAMEDNGLENAKELTTHIERWLSQSPDRTAWQMEEPVTQNDQHMAELPKQLQDMVGDLMDKEEDLTPEMESLASKSVDSLDKGAGWDAMDGPISNMTAQGVTGNQMPKDMEIQGRSGEGREGRASGEMVGSEAEGKEGRRTPTRLTPDPFSNSQVNDKSTLPEGGATGGGKKGNVGGEGLEGPGPAQDPGITQRLAGQQSAIRNDAERLALQMHAAGFDNFKLIEANAYLKKSEDALKANQYQTALYYQEQAVQSLNTAKVLASGELHVVADTSPTADAKTQKQVDSAMNGPMPKGYAGPVKAYFEKLAGQ